LLGFAGIGEERLHLAWVSSAEAQRFAEVTTSVTNSIKDQGKFDAEAFALELGAAEMTLTDEVLRWMVGKEIKITQDGDVYGREWEVEKYELILDSVLEREYQKNLIYLAIKEGSTSVREINKRIGLDLQLISRLIADMEKTSKVEFTGMENKIPVFAAR
jgi:hypothetical protein